MSHLKQVFDSKGDFLSPVLSDVDRIVNYDEDGFEHITYEPVDYPKIQESLGSFALWSLQSLVDAGIDPRFGIRTGFNTGLDAERAIGAGVDVISKSVESEKSE